MDDKEKHCMIAKFARDMAEILYKMHVCRLIEGQARDMMRLLGGPIGRPEYDKHYAVLHMLSEVSNTSLHVFGKLKERETAVFGMMAASGFSELDISAVMDKAKQLAKADDYSIFDQYGIDLKASAEDNSQKLRALLVL